jgi:drug/metabolite transporter (DMT)-like permease
VFFALIREIGATRALVVTYVNPAVAVAAGVMFLGEPFTPAMIGAFAMILAGSVLATGPGRAPAGEDLGAIAVGGQELLDAQLAHSHNERND